MSEDPRLRECLAAVYPTIRLEWNEPDLIHALEDAGMGAPTEATQADQAGTNGTVMICVIRVQSVGLLGLYAAWPTTHL